MKGYVDTPANRDLFHIERYVSGLGKFIAECDTPMTIAIQGDWGSGKTSLMKMVSESFKENDEIIPVWFNTWQFSQFSLGDQLPILMVTKLINSIGGKDDSAKKTAKEILSKIGDIAVSHFTAGYAGYDTVSRIVNDITDGDLIDQFDNLRSEFEKLVNERTGKTESGRIVFFIDDLDRINPEKAVEILEVLKLFLECKHCVFVLAIDYAVVVQGVKEKYGDIDEEKAKAFFDKIIQVQFRMPLENYDIHGYIFESLKSLGIEYDRRFVQRLDTLLITSVGNNPRSIKRILNGYLLLKDVNDEWVLDNANNQLILFALLCMQSQYPKLYDYIVMQRGNLNADTIVRIKNQEQETIKRIGYSREQFETVAPFFDEFYEVLDKDGDGEINNAELMQLGNILGFSEFFMRQQMDNRPKRYVTTNNYMEDREVIHKWIDQNMGKNM